MAEVQDLAALRIDRSKRRGPSPARWVGALLVLVLLGGGVAAFLHLRGTAVAVEPVVLDSAGGELTAAGYIVADRRSTLAAKTTGRLVKLYVTEAQRVYANQPVALLEHRDIDAQLMQVQAEQAVAVAECARLRKELAQAEAEAAAALLPAAVIEAESGEIRIALEDARRRLARDKETADKGAGSRSEAEDRLTEVRTGEARLATAEQRKLEAASRATVAQRRVGVAGGAIQQAEAQIQAIAARARLLTVYQDDAVIRAPFDGVVIEKVAEEGEIVAPVSVGGTMAKGAIVTIADWSSLQAEVDVAESQVARVRDGGRAAVTVDAIPGRIFPGRVRRILPRADRNKATVQVRVDFAESDARMRPDMGLRVRFLPEDALPGAEKAPPATRLLIPQTAVQAGPGPARVWVVEDGRATRREVQVASAGKGHWEVLGGLSADEQVVTQGAEALTQDGQRVSVRK